MEFLKDIFDSAGVIVIALTSIVSSIATVALVFIPQEKVEKFSAPILKVLNILAGNLGKNK